MTNYEQHDHLPVLDRIKHLDEERAALAEQARAAAVQQIDESIAVLNALGFDFRVVDARKTAPTSARSVARKSKRPPEADRPCPICQFMTEPAHDARRHRSQGDDKLPFTVEQLTELGMCKVE